MRLLIKFLFFAIILTGQTGCIFVGALAMTKEEKTTVDAWEDTNFKIRIQRRRGWSGPHYYHCRIRSKKLGGLYYKTIVSETFSREMYSTCLISFPLRRDTLELDICSKRISHKESTAKPK